MLDFHHKFLPRVNCLDGRILLDSNPSLFILSKHENTLKNWRPSCFEYDFDGAKNKNKSNSFSVFVNYIN